MLNLRQWSIKRISLWAAVLLLLLTFGRSLESSGQKSPVYDEQGFIVRGLGYLRGENQHMRIGHPLGLNALVASLLVADETIKLPTDDPSWQTTSFHRPSELFLWEIGNDVEKLMFLARLPMLWLTLLMGALVMRWARMMSGRWEAGLIAIGLLLLDPNILAHSRFTTTDIGLAAGVTFSAFGLWSFFQKPTWKRAIFAGIAFGLLQNTKFTSGLFVPLYTIVLAIYFGVRLYQDPGRWRELGRFVVAFPLAGFITLWGCYGFEIGRLPVELPIMSEQFGGMVVPLANHLENLLDIGGRIEKETPAFLLGSYSSHGWWYYFPVVFLLKTPLATLILLLWGTGYWLMGKSGLGYRDYLPLLIPAWGYFLIGFSSEINLGYRHLLPMLPLLAVFMGVTIRVRGNGRWLLGGLFLWLGVSSWLIAPHYLGYFNELVGGAEEGWHYLGDSNIDWGQDLPGLKSWMDENGVEEIWLSYFGEAYPAHYGISFRGLDGSPPRWMNPYARPFLPDAPAPGIYAISVTNLQGILFENHELFSWFRDKEPIAKIGHSIFLYEVEPVGELKTILLSGIQLDQLQDEDIRPLASNQISPRWYERSESFIWPATGEVWRAVGADDGGYRWERCGMGEEKNWTSCAPEWVYEIESKEEIIFVENEMGGMMQLLGIDGGDRERLVGEPLTFVSEWKVGDGERPFSFKMFVHLMDGEQLVGQWDGASFVTDGVQAGDLIWQKHHLEAPKEAGVYQLYVGLYHPETGERWMGAFGDRYYVGEMEWVADE